MAIFEDPLARRELSGVARRWPTFVSRTLVGLSMLWAVFYLWERSGWVYGYGGYSAVSSLSREVFAAYFGGLMALLPLLAVTGAADLITKEVRNGTLGLLFLTPLTPWRIALGKWKAAMAQVLLILLAGGPVAAICVYLGGVGILEILWGAALPFATAAFAAAVSLFFSTVFRGPTMTIIASVLALIAGILVPIWLCRDTPDDGLEILAYIHTIPAAVVCAEPRVARSAALAETAWIGASLSALLCSVIVLFATAARLPGRLAVVPGPSFLSRLMAGLDRFFERINVGRVRFFTRGGEVWQERALLWKELRVRATGKLRHATRVSVVLLFLSVLPFLGSDRNERDWIRVFLWVFPALLTLQAVALGSSLFVHEREGRQWDVLLSTPLTTDEIVRAKLTGGLAGLAPTALAGLIYLGLIASIFPNGVEIAFIAAAPAGLFALFAFLLSAAASLRASTLRGAFGMSIGVLLAILLGIPLAGALIDELPGWNIRERDVLPPTNPGWYLGEACDSLSYSYYSSSPRVDGGYLVGYFFLYGLATFGLWTYLSLSFNRHSGRADV